MALADLHEKCFTRDMKVTLVARHPTEAERHLVCGDDDLAQVAKLVKSKAGPQPPTGEQIHALWRAAIQNTPDGKPEGTRESLAMCATMIDTYAPDLDPCNEQGQVSFSRAMMESVASEIRAFLATLPAEQAREGGGVV